jgi:hypothetical protein
LHRQHGRQFIRVDVVEEDELDEAGDQILRAFEGWEELSKVDGSGRILDRHVSVAMPLLFERELEPDGSRVVDVEGRIELADGMKLAVDATADEQEVIASLDADLTLRAVVEATADRLGFSDEELAQLQSEVVAVVELLIELGALNLK